MSGTLCHPSGFMPIRKKWKAIAPKSPPKPCAKSAYMHGTFLIDDSSTWMDVLVITTCRLIGKSKAGFIPL